MPIIVTADGIEQYLTRKQEKLTVPPEQKDMSTRYVHQDYPRWVKNPDGKKTLVKTSEEEQALRATWEPQPEISIPATINHEDNGKKFFGGRKGKR